MEEMKEYLGLNPCSCGGKVVMMSEKAYFGIYCGYRLCNYSAFVICKGCHKVTAKFQIQGAENEQDWHDVMLRAKNIWNQYHT